MIKSLIHMKDLYCLRQCFYALNTKMLCSHCCTLYLHLQGKSGTDRSHKVCCQWPGPVQGAQRFHGVVGWQAESVNKLFLIAAMIAKL